MKTIVYPLLLFALLLSGCDYEYILVYQLENTTNETVQVIATRTSNVDSQTIEVGANTCITFLTDEIIGKRKRNFSDSEADTIGVAILEITQNGDPFIGNEKQFDRWVISDETGKSTFVLTVSDADFN